MQEPLHCKKSATVDDSSCLLELRLLYNQEFMQGMESFPVFMACPFLGTSTLEARWDEDDQSPVFWPHSFWNRALLSEWGLGDRTQPSSPVHACPEYSSSNKELGKMRNANDLPGLWSHSCLNWKLEGARTL